MQLIGGTADACRICRDFIGGRKTNMLVYSAYAWNILYIQSFRDTKYPINKRFRDDIFRYILSSLKYIIDFQQITWTRWLTLIYYVEYSVYFSHILRIYVNLIRGRTDILSISPRPPRMTALASSVGHPWASLGR